MLRDRITLVQHELHKLSDRAAHMYLDAMVSANTISPEYDSIRSRITELQHEAQMIQRLLNQGHK